MALSQQTRGIIIAAIAIPIVLTLSVANLIAKVQVQHQADRTKATLTAYLTSHSRDQLSLALLGAGSGLATVGLPKGFTTASNDGGTFTIREKVTSFWLSRCVTATRSPTGVVQAKITLFGCA